MALQAGNPRWASYMSDGSTLWRSCRAVPIAIQLIMSPDLLSSAQADAVEVPADVAVVLGAPWRFAVRNSRQSLILTIRSIALSQGRSRVGLLADVAVVFGAAGPHAACGWRGPGRPAAAVAVAMIAWQGDPVCQGDVAGGRRGSRRPAAAAAAAVISWQGNPILQGVAGGKHLEGLQRQLLLQWTSVMMEVVERTTTLQEVSRSIRCRGEADKHSVLSMR